MDASFTARNRTYLTLAVIFVCSLLAAVLFHFFPVGVVGDLAAIPSVVALLGALFQLSRDSIAHERAVQLEETRNRLTVGATSHMASVAFDKHVSFCEEYVAEVFSALETLYRKGPHEGILQNAGGLYGIRKKWAVWLTPEIERALEQFETKLRTIGANAQVVAQVPGEQDAIREMFSEFAAVLGSRHGFAKWAGKPVPQEYAIDAVISGLRKVLGIDELTQMRSALVARATEKP